MIKCSRSNRCCENQWPTQSIFIFHPAGCGALSSQCTSEAALTTWVIVVCSSLHAALRQGHPPQAVEQGFTSPWIWGRIIVLYSTAQGICSFWKHILTALQIMLVSFFLSQDSVSCELDLKRFFKVVSFIFINFWVHSPFSWFSDMK